MQKTIITVVGKDNIGIIGRVGTYLADNNINILDISQTIIDGFFNMMMITNTEPCPKNLAVIREELQQIGLELGVNIHIQHEDIFEKMHRI